MHDTAVIARRTEVARRWRRIVKRRTRRQVGRILGFGFVIFSMAALAAPERVKVASPASPPSTFSIQPLWRPAGSVLQRKVSPIPAPWAADTASAQPRANLTRWHNIYTFSTRFKTSPEMARKVYDGAIREGIEPELAFRLVRVESEFNPRATSPVGALGLTQLMLGTARDFQPGVTRNELYDPETNLRIGFRYLRVLIRENKGDLRLALLVYNRGPLAVQAALDLGQDPANGYELVVMKGYRGRGTLD